MRSGYKARPAEQRFWPKVFKHGPTPAHRPDLGPCWLWTASKRTGYGAFLGSNKRVIPAHVFAYELLVGPIPKGATVDHLCHPETCDKGNLCPHRACVNPVHLEATSRGENVLRGNSGPAKNARKTHCIRGHEFAGLNLLITKRGWRGCRACARIKDRERYHRNRARAA